MRKNILIYTSISADTGRKVAGSRNSFNPGHEKKGKVAAFATGSNFRRPPDSQLRYSKPLTAPTL